ncbi:MAG TPA: urea ABC transporter substrate-binding protein [Myxococcales bacterium]|jgi:urea transport system substrate-binding protein|nr:urea ABC transporter substrate-binding protein [Myxococcales bacterium]
MARTLPRRLQVLAALAVAAAALGGAALWRARPRPLRVGVLHSLTGTMAVSELPVQQATVLAIEELNAGGGVLGRPVEAVLADSASDGAVALREAQRLIHEEHVRALFGCWTSACRRSVRPAVERAHLPYFYPLQYEGLEDSPYIVHCGAAPNQQILPAVDWAVEHLGKRAFLVGSDYIFPRIAHQLIRDHLEVVHGTAVGEEYLPLGATDVSAVIEKIAAAKPEVIFNTINGDTNVAFFRALRAAGIASSQVPAISFSIAEAELQAAGAKDFAGDYAAWSYFQSLPGDANRAFVERYRARFGAGRVTDDPMEAAYLGVHLWAQAVEAAGTDEPEAVLAAVRSQAFPAPEGMVYVDPKNLHLWKTPRLGQIQPDGQFTVVWSDRQTPAAPFPLGRSKLSWGQLTESLYRGWGNAWAAPGVKP